jgi:putative transposase
MQLYARDGYGQTSMSSIAAALGGSKATLYKYFPSREALFETAMVRQPVEFRSLHESETPLKNGSFTESQIVAVLKEGETGVPVAELCRKHGISNATYYQWKSKYSGVQVSELQRLRELEAENAKLKRMYADLALENSAIKDVLNRKF